MDAFSITIISLWILFALLSAYILGRIHGRRAERAKQILERQFWKDQ